MLRVKVFLLFVIAICVLISGCPGRDEAALRLSRAADLFNNGKPRAASAAISAAIKANPSQFDIYAASITLLTEKKRYRDAARISDVLLERMKSGRLDHRLTHEELASTYTMLGTVYQEVPDLTKAERVYKAALAIAPNSPALLNNLGWFYADKGIKLNEALRLTKRAVKLDPGDGNIIDSYGWAQYKLGQYVAAVHTLKRAVEIEPNNAELRCHLGAAFSKVGMYTEAGIELNKALSIDANMTMTTNPIVKLHK